ncbi:hypothetical protein F2P79_004562 [Pimephales promelas]|nr:hypothetical protein F2P79_004562 [Pimephales promelas]
MKNQRAVTTMTDKDTISLVEPTCQSILMDDAEQHKEKESHAEHREDTPSGILLLSTVSSRDVPPTPSLASTGSHGMKGWRRKRVEIRSDETDKTCARCRNCFVCCTDLNRIFWRCEL